jgi:3-deoxy-manno-octulosonate cytidylyltransferase (CMP-KDO synthetase)
MFRVVIPARYGSTRFPGKPLVEVAGRPLLAWVLERARRCSAVEVLIATDDERIAQLGRRLGATVAMTRADHASGTDRIAEVAALRAWKESDVVVNLQGDEPLMPAALLDQVAAALASHPEASIATVATPLHTLAEFLDPNVVKVVTDGAGRALYFSRAPIPWNRDAAQGPDVAPRFDGARRHVGLYAYRVAALRQLAGLAPTRLEKLESLEQLRALESGLQIRVVDASERPGADVNTPRDLIAVAAALSASAGPGQGGER